MQAMRILLSWNSSLRQFTADIRTVLLVRSRPVKPWREHCRESSMSFVSLWLPGSKSTRARALSRVEYVVREFMATGFKEILNAGSVLRAPAVHDGVGCQFSYAVLNFLWTTGV